MATASKSGDKPVKPAAKTAAQPKAARVAKAAKATKAPAKKPAAVKKAAPVKRTAATVAEQPNEQPGAVPVLTPDQRRYYVEVAAYYIAERRGFRGGSQMDDWVQAESEIDRMVREGILKP